MYEWKEVCKSKIIIFQLFDCSPSLWLHMSMSCCCCYHTLMHNNRVPLFTIFVSEKDLYMRNTIVIVMRKKKRRWKKSTILPLTEFSSLIFYMWLLPKGNWDISTIIYFTLLNFFYEYFSDIIRCDMNF